MAFIFIKEICLLFTSVHFIYSPNIIYIYKKIRDSTSQNQAAVPVDNIYF